DVGELCIAKFEVGLDLLQGYEGIRALAARRAMGVGPETGDARPERFGGPAHRALPTGWAHRAQLRKINDLPRHKAGTNRAQCRPRVDPGPRVPTQSDCVLVGDSGTGRLTTVRGQSRPCRTTGEVGARLMALLALVSFANRLDEPMRPKTVLHGSIVVVFASGR